ncbi:MAG TPA: diguanylate cyclase [Baekduia sp.]|uniref:diguanylate cyclase n=1 Tax=Baekduia sp. TaxID=2600305 RepID=UPI002BBEE5E0|nr:diguanylate cyclase [Baekduia sp.]HMJ33168.1 diguanylate cyclase [Baekduia sp.]
MSDRGPFGDLRDRLSSFRTRLRLFFVLIVIVPMVAVTLVVFRLIAESEHGQADARVAARQEAAISLYYDARANADRLAAQLGRDQALAAALRGRDPQRIRTVARRLLAKTTADRIVLSSNGKVWADVGDPRASFPATRSLVADGRPVAELQVSVLDAQEYARLVKRVTQLETIVRRGGRVIASTIPSAGGASLPSQTGKVTVGGREYRAASFGAPGFLGEHVQVSVLEPEAATAGDIRNGRLVAGLVLAGFFLLALVAAVVVSRSLNRQIEEFLAAARRLGGGDFSAKAPTRGRDQFAQLGEEFNKMSRELEGRLEELGEERQRLESSLRRIGETFASNLDRDGLLEIVVRTAVDALDARGGHALTRRGPDGELGPVASVGSGDERPAAAVEAERRVLAVGEPGFASVDGGHALAHPLRAGPAAGARADTVTGLIAVWRTGRPFSHRESELFHYLAGQAAVSIENVGLHETVERQAVTDELTGLSNRRRFQETMTAEVERSKRFGQDLGLVMLDIDDFKAVNDTYGHQQGDIVLREVARILRASSREIDEPARYGGEELAVVLPGTNLEGAYNLAERVREGIEALRLPIVGDEGGEPLRVTASFGAAALPACADSVRGLVAAADEALYQAKRGGKNRTVGAG